jgi:hypothetical protein
MMKERKKGMKGMKGIFGRDMRYNVNVNVNEPG